MVDKSVEEWAKEMDLKPKSKHGLKDDLWVSFNEDPELPSRIVKVQQVYGWEAAKLYTFQQTAIQVKTDTTLRNAIRDWRASK